MSRALLVLLLVISVASFTDAKRSLAPKPAAAAPKVMVGAYIESYCPDCMDMIVDYLYPAFTNGLDSIIDLIVYPYGNAKEAQNGTQWAYTCQHGVKECTGNFIEVCAIKYYPDPAVHFPYIYCLENSGDPNANAASCAQQQNLNYTIISACANGPEANALEHAAAVNTDALVPAHQWVPWITINGQHISEDVDGNPIASICAAYTGSAKPAACTSPAAKSHARKARKPKAAGAPKVMVGLYIESYCPDCMDMITTSLYPAYTNGLDSIVDLVLVPYGNAKEAQNGTQWTYTCQHGDKECQGNFIEVCAIKYYPAPSVHFPFIYCLENSGDPINNVASCATTANVNATIIMTCAKGVEGNALEHAAAVATDALQPAHQWVPWVTVNGMHDEDWDDDPVAAICAAYTGSPKPAACTKA